MLRLLILESCACRLEPQFDPPAKIEDANSPVGPLQRHVAEPYLEEWKHIDWPAFNLGQESFGVYEHGFSRHGESGATNESATCNDALFRVAGDDLNHVGSEYYSA